jgi:hypothetical protein
LMTEVQSQRAHETKTSRSVSHEPTTRHAAAARPPARAQPSRAHPRSQNTAEC